MFNFLIFFSSRALRQGMHDLRLWNNLQADGNLRTKTPGKTDCCKEQMTKLSKVRKLLKVIVFNKCCLYKCKF